MSKVTQWIFGGRRRTHIVMAAFAIAALPLRANIALVSTFSSANPPYETSTGNAWAVGTPGNSELGVVFQDPSSSISYVLDQIQAADNFSVSDPNATALNGLNNLIIGFWQNSTNDLNTATLLQSWSVPPASGPSTPPQVYTVTSMTPTIISPNAFYFVTESVTPDGANTAEWGWQENNLTPMQIGLYFGANGTPNSWTFESTPCTVFPCNATNDPNADGTPAFSVSGNPVATPEPRSAILLCAAIGGLLFLRRRRTV